PAPSTSRGASRGSSPTPPATPSAQPSGRDSVVETAGRLAAGQPTGRRQTATSATRLQPPGGTFCGMPSLARTEARERAALLTVHNYAIDLELSEHEPRFRSETTISFDCARPGAASFLDLRPAELESVQLNGAELDP